MRLIRIADRDIGDGQPPFIVAEVGLNHNGSLDRALGMVHVAKHAGCDAVKFGTFKAEEFCQPSDPLYHVFKSCELEDSDWQTIKSECDQIGILFFSTPQNRTDLNLLLKVGVPAIKVGSDDFTHLPLLKDYATEKLPMILSLGMATLGEVYQAVCAVKCPKALLVCTSLYPCEPKNANLKRITTLRREFPWIPIGWSDHTEGSISASAAVALGACILETHFTQDKALPGPDHWFSKDSIGLKEWATTIRESYEMLGDGVVKPTPEEMDCRKLFRRDHITGLRGVAA